MKEGVDVIDKYVLAIHSLHTLIIQSRHLAQCGDKLGVNDSGRLIDIMDNLDYLFSLLEKRDFELFEKTLKNLSKNKEYFSNAYAVWLAANGL